eukprot:2276254-Rhodomonas_salina.1
MVNSCTECGVKVGKDPQDPNKCQFFDERNPNLFWAFQFQAKRLFNWSCKHCCNWQTSDWSANFCKLCCNCAQEHGWDRYNSYGCGCCKNRAAGRVAVLASGAGDEGKKEAIAAEAGGKSKDEKNLEGDSEGMKTKVLLLLASEDEPQAKAAQNEHFQF